MVAVLSSSFSISISTSSPTASGLVEVISSILNTPLIRALKLFPSFVLTMYQLPVDLYTSPRMDLLATNFTNCHEGLKYQSFILKFTSAKVNQQTDFTAGGFKIVNYPRNELVTQTVFGRFHFKNDTF